MSRAVAAAVLLLVAVTACSSEPEGIDGVRRFPDLAHDHPLGPQSYSPVPPAGGPHNPKWLRCGVYAEPVPDEFAVHSMEHGAIWVTYRPDLPAAEVSALAALARLRPDYVLVSPYPGLPSPVVASTWGLQLTVDSASDERLERFVRRYAGGNQGGEMGADCAHGVTPAEGRALLAPSPSPSN